MDVNKIHPLLLKNKQFGRDFEAVLQNEKTAERITPSCIEKKLKTLNATYCLTFVNGQFQKEYSILPEVLLLKNEADFVITQTVEHPIVFCFLGDETHEKKINLTLTANQKAEVLQAFYSTPSSFGHYKINLICEENGVLSYHCLQNIETSASHVVEIIQTQAKNSTVLNAIGLLTGFRTAVLLETHPLGEGTHTKTEMLSFLKGKSVAHLVSHTLHSVPNGNSETEIKSLVSDKARLQFLGKIDVGEAASETDARLKHQSLLLSDTAEVSSEPQLEINNKHVKCAHGATVGQLDKSALFYFMSRGVSLQTAKAMLMEAFCTTLINDAKNTFWKDEMMAALSTLGASV